jgi:signal transduction protein with GAF and PtsI domain
MLGTLEALRDPPGKRGKSLAVEAFEEVSSLLRRAITKVRPSLDGAPRRALNSLALTLDDRRLYDTLSDSTDRLGTVRGLRQLARQYAGTIAQGADADPFLEQRAIEVENLCLLVATRAAGYPLPSNGALLVVAEHLSAFSALALVGAGAAGALAASPLEPDDLGVRVLEAAALPVVADVTGLFAWVRPGDTLRIDGSSGVVRVNPPATAIRRHRRKKGASPISGPPAVPPAGGPASDR